MAKNDVPSQFNDLWETCDHLKLYFADPYESSEKKLAKAILKFVLCWIHFKNFTSSRKLQLLSSLEECNIAVYRPGYIQATFFIRWQDALEKVIHPDDEFRDFEHKDMEELILLDWAIPGWGNKEPLAKHCHFADM